jgi:hypothetical protein
MENPGDQDRAAKIRQARQVLVGTEIPPVNDSVGFGNRVALAGSAELRYLLGLAVMIVVAAAVWAFWGMGPASPILFLLALALLAGWFLL